MKSFNVQFFVLSVLSLALASGCKTKSELRREQDLERLKQEVKEVRGDKADVEVMSDELKNEITRLGSLIEESAHNNRQQTDELKKEMAALVTRIQALENRATSEDLAAKQANEAQRAAVQAQAKAEAERPTGLEGGRKLFEEGKFDEAVEVLRPVAKGKKGKEARLALLLLAESYYSAKDYASAALEFSEYHKTYPKDSQAPLSVYRQANAFKAMGKKSEARLFYKELIESYPKSSYAGKAKQELKRLK